MLHLHVPGCRRVVSIRCITWSSFEVGMTIWLYKPLLFTGHKLLCTSLVILDISILKRCWLAVSRLKIDSAISVGVPIGSLFLLSAFYRGSLGDLIMYCANTALSSLPSSPQHLQPLPSARKFCLYHGCRPRFFLFFFSFFFVLSLCLLAVISIPPEQLLD
jgi:hypothetical protein